MRSTIKRIRFNPQSRWAGKSASGCGRPRHAGTMPPGVRTSGSAANALISGLTPATSRREMSSSESSISPSRLVEVAICPDSRFSSPVLPAADLALEIGGEQREGMHRLPQVVAGGGEKAALGAVGAIGLVFLDGQFVGRFPDPFRKLFVAGGQLLRHGLHLANLAAYQPAAEKKNQGDEQDQGAQLLGARPPGGEQARFGQYGEDAQVGEARYRRQRGDQSVVARDAGRRQPVAQAGRRRALRARVRRGSAIAC